jgi:1-acyl-sn-glycerol-3-phosphate acyltransferase
LALRAVLALPLIAAVTVVLGLPAIVFGIFRRFDLVRSVTVVWGRAVLWTLGIEVTVAGGQHCPAGPAVYAANHASVLDIPILYAHLPVDFRIIHKRSLYLIPVMGLYLYATGHIGIDRGNAFRAHRGLQRAAARVRDGGSNLVVFPEGTRSRCGEVGPFKRGLFALALEAEVPVVPLSLIGVKQVARGGLDVHAGTVRLVVHPPIPTAGRGQAQAGVLAEEVRGIVSSGCAAA